MAKKEDYVKYVNMAKKLINKYGTELTVVLGLDATDEDKPFEYDETKVLSYVTTGVIMPSLVSSFSIRTSLSFFL